MVVGRKNAGPGVTLGAVTAGLFALASGCADDRGSSPRQSIGISSALEGIPTAFDHNEYLAGTLLGEPLVQADVLGLPLTLASAGDQLFIGDAALSPAIHVARLSDGEILESIGRRGEGPGEFMALPRFFGGAWGTEERIWAYDPALGRATGIPLGGRVRRDEDGFEVRRLGLDFSIHDLRPLSDTLLVGWGLWDSARLVIMGHDGKAIGGLGTVPDPPSLKTLNPMLRQRAYQPFIAVSPDRSKVALAAWRASRVDLFPEPMEGREISTDGPFSFPADVELTETLRANRLMRGPASRAGHLGIAATESAVITLFSGRLEYAFRDRMDEGEFLHVYQWDGSFVRAYRLDRAARAIACADGSCNTLLAVVWSPAPAVIRYHLPEGWDAPGR
jgi:hypothetical protein